MLELRPNCEHCGVALPPSSTDAMVCSFECTYCRPCVEAVLANVCPNCGGGFERRPVRPTRLLEKYPASTTRVFKPVDEASFAALRARQRDVPAHLR